MYYVYLYLDPRKINNEWQFEPFYVGRGQGQRDKSHLAEARKYKGANLDLVKGKRLNMLKINKINAITNSGFQPLIVRHLVALTLNESKVREKELIKKIGRSFLGEGPLTNLTEGGESRVVCHAGPFNPFYGKKCSEEHRALLSLIHSGKTISPEQREMISKALKGKKKSHVTTEAMRTSMRKRFIENPNQKMFQILGDTNRKTWEVKNPNGEIFTVSSLKALCEKHGLNYTTLLSAYRKNRPVFSGRSAGWQLISSS